MIAESRAAGLAVWPSDGHRDRGDGPVGDGGSAVRAEPVLVSWPGRHVGERRAASGEDVAGPVRRVRVAIGTGVQEELGKGAEDHDPEHQENPHAQQPPDQALREEEAVAEQPARQEHRRQVLRQHAETWTRAEVVPQQVGEQQKRGATHAQRGGRSGGQLPGRPTVGGLVEAAAGDEQHDQRHDRQKQRLLVQRDRPSPGPQAGDVHAWVGADRVTNLDTGSEHGQVDDHREPPG